MRILMVTDFYPPLVGGVEVVVSSLSRALAERGHDVSVATIRTNGLPAQSDDGDVRVHRLTCSVQRGSRMFRQRRPWAPPCPDPEATIALRRIAFLERPDVVHGHDWLARSFLPIRRSTGVPFVMSLHYYTLSCAKKSLMYRGAPCSGPRLGKCLRCAGDHYGVAKGSAVAISNFCFAAAERSSVSMFLAVSEAVAAGNGLPGGKVPYEVIPNLVPEAGPVPHRREAALDALPAEFVLFVGDLRREKGIDVLLDAYAGLRAPPPLVLIGKVWEETPKLPPNAMLITDWPNELVREAQRRCLMLVAPSIWPEPFGLVVPEAFSAGRPVIASRIAGLDELVEDGVEGLMTPPGDPGSLRDALERLLGDADLREELGRNARRSALRFSPERIVPRFEAVYERVGSRRAT